MTTTPELLFPQAVLLCPRQDAALLTFARNVHGALLGNPSFPGPDPTLAVFLEDIDAFAGAQDRTATRARGTVKTRNAKRRVVKADLHHLRDYIQGVAEKAASPADAAALITSVFLSVKKSTTRNKPELAAKNTGISGQVLLDAKAVAPDTIYFWEYSVDQRTWTVAAETMRCKTTISGLTTATIYYFRFRALTRKGPRDYSQVVSLIVH